jgi:hypothetical protein
MQYSDENKIQDVIDGNGFFKEINTQNSNKGEIKNGLQEGVWESSNKKSKTRYIESFRKGKFISGESFNANNISFKYTKVEIKPKPKGEINCFYKCIGNNFKLSTQASKNKISGVILHQFHYRLGR